ncbi:hypothetical protein AB6A40_001769 [Gnathostoma spinigerum]|uniref:Uncharacterized protein n=1 Tax=Gnathostoma spinigerum TaxID=75299 RepID=A0ABD6EFG9_9BILA
MFQIELHLKMPKLLILMLLLMRTVSLIDVQSKAHSSTNVPSKSYNSSKDLRQHLLRNLNKFPSKKGEKMEVMESGAVGTKKSADKNRVSTVIKPPRQNADVSYAPWNPEDVEKEVDRNVGQESGNLRMVEPGIVPGVDDRNEQVRDLRRRLYKVYSPNHQIAFVHPSDF